MYTILVVDDDDKLRMMVRRLLEKEGHRIIEACDGEGAIKVFKATAPDLAILDVNMGDGPSGFEVCREIRKDSYGVSIPIIFLTAMRREESLLKGFKEGGDDYIKKPFSLPEFRARVAAQLDRIDRSAANITKLGNDQFKSGSIIQGEGDEEYQILSRISSGGMGVIFRGYRVSDKLPIAIKTLNSNFLENYKDIQRFLREANATIQLRHPNIAEGIEVVRKNQYCFFVMKYVEGESLVSILDRENYIEPELACNIVIQIALGLEHFNKFSLVHRDIKPGNILLVNREKAILVDMGLTKAVDAHQPDLTTEGIILGTPYYLSPEQALGEALDIRSDIYSLGATFYHSITGVVPFRGSTTIAIINARFIDNPEEPNNINPNIPTEISAIINKMMSHHPNDRYQNPSDLIRALKDVRKQLYGY